MLAGFLLLLPCSQFGLCELEADNEPLAPATAPVSAPAPAPAPAYVGPAQTSAYVEPASTPVPVSTYVNLAPTYVKPEPFSEYLSPAPAYKPPSPGIEVPAATANSSERGVEYNACASYEYEVRNVADLVPLLLQLLPLFIVTTLATTVATIFGSLIG